MFSLGTAVEVWIASSSAFSYLMLFLWTQRWAEAGPPGGHLYRVYRAEWQCCPSAEWGWVKDSAQSVLRWCWQPFLWWCIVLSCNQRLQWRSPTEVGVALCLSWPQQCHRSTVKLGTPATFFVLKETTSSVSSRTTLHSRAIRMRCVKGGTGAGV